VRQYGSAILAIAWLLVLITGYLPTIYRTLTIVG